MADLAGGLCEGGHEVTLIHGTSRAEPAFLHRVRSIAQLTTIAQDNLFRPVGLHDVKALRDLQAIVREHGPFDILHGHSSKAGALMRLLPRSIPGARIYTPHALRTMDPELGQTSRHIYRLIEAQLARRTDRIIAVSQYEARHASALGLGSGDRVVTIPNGLAPSTLRARDDVRRELGIAPGDFAVVQVGRLCPQKDPVRFVDAISIAHRRRPDIRGFLIGDGELRGDVEAAVAAHRGVSVLGARDAAPLLSGFDAFMMTSRYEAFPYTYIEALQAGLPIITTSVGGADDVVGPDNGMILPVNATPELLAEAILTQCKPARLAEAGAASSARAASFTLETMVSNTEQIYHDTLRSLTERV